MTELALFDHAKEALAAAVRIDEVQSIRNKARQAEAYGKIARDRTLIAHANEVIARAERKLGIMLRAAKDNGLLSQGGRPAERSNLSEPETGADAEPVFDNTPFTLADIGVDKKLSARAQKLAELAEDQFEQAVADKREKILSADAPLVNAPKVRTVAPTPKSAKIEPLAPRRFHQFAFSVLALTMRSDRVGSEAIQFLAENCGVLVRDGETVDFSPEAIEAFGNLATAALKALDGEESSQAKASGDGGATEPGVEEPADSVSGDASRASSGAGTAAPLSTDEADAIIRAGYAAEPPTPVADLAVAIGRKQDQAGKAYVRNRARVMKLSSRDNQRAAASAFATAQHAARKGTVGLGQSDGEAQQ